MTAIPLRAADPSTAVASEGTISQIHPSPYGSALRVSGASDSDPFTATTSPATGA